MPRRYDKDSIDLEFEFEEKPIIKKIFAKLEKETHIAGFNKKYKTDEIELIRATYELLKDDQQTVIE